MTRAISFNFFGWVIAKIGEIGEATRHWEKIKKIRVEARTLEGIEFIALPEGQECRQLALSNLIYEPENDELRNQLSTEQLTVFDLIHQAAQLSGFAIEAKRIVFHDHAEPVLFMSLKPATRMRELIGEMFEDQKALPPASFAFDKFIGFNWDKTDLVAVKSRN